MTKEQTLKGLEICKNISGGIGCGGCPYLEMHSSDCLARLLGDAYILLQEYTGAKND